jgi:peptide/nickel transport system permease protein
MGDRFRQLWAILARTPGARAALALVGVLLVLALLAPAIAPYPAERSLDLLRLKLQPPSLAHPFGTDPFSRDVLSRVLVGARVALGIAVLAVALATLMGTVIGALAGTLGGWVDALCMRLVDAAMAVPRVLLVITIVALWGSASTIALVLLLGGTGWFSLARLVRTEVRALVARDFVQAAQALGVSPRRRFTHHLIPHLIPLLLANATLSVATVIAVEAALSYLGLGVRPPTPSWGNIMLEGSGQVGQYWWLTLFPALATIVTVAALHTLGDGLRTAFSSRQLDPVPSTDAVR